MSNQDIVSFKVYMISNMDLTKIAKAGKLFVSIFELERIVVGRPGRYEIIGMGRLVKKGRRRRRLLDCRQYRGSPL